MDPTDSKLPDREYKGSCRILTNSYLKTLIRNLAHPFWGMVGFLLVLLPGYQIMAQQYSTRIYTESEGLVTNTVFDIKQDSSGVLWIARRAGISSFDGLSFTNYYVANGLRAGTYAFLCIDRKNSVWALPESGQLCISRFNGKKWETFFPPDNFTCNPNVQFTSLEVFYTGDDYNCLIGTAQDGIILARNGVWKHISTRDGLLSKRVTDIEYFDTKIFVASDSGLACFSEGIISHRTRTLIPSLNEPVLHLSKDDGKIWYLTEKRLGYLNDNTPVIVAEINIPPVDIYKYPWVITPGGKGSVFFGNSYRLFYYSIVEKKLVTLGKDNGIITEGANTAFVDREQNLWIGSFRGISKISSMRFSTYTEKNGLYDNEIASALMIDSVHYLFGHEAGLTYYDGKQFKAQALRKEVNSLEFYRRALDLEMDKNGNVWLAASSLGVGRINSGKNITWYDKKDGLRGVAFSVVESSAGQIFVATSEGLFRFNGRTFTKHTLNPPLNTKEIIRKIFPAPDNSLYLGMMSSGIIHLKGNTSTLISAESPMYANSIYSFLWDRDGNRWVGTMAGLYEIRDRQLVKVDKDGLSLSCPVFLILQDKEGTLWFGTDNGIYRWKNRTLNHFTTTDGLAGQEINRDAGFIDASGNVWIGTSNGLSLFRPAYDYDPKSIPPPLVSLISLQIGNDTLMPDRDITLKHNQNNLEFNVRVISFINENKILYKYRLLNQDTGWSAAQPYNSSKICFNNLKAGRYRIQIKACNALGVWSQPVTSGSILIRQPFLFRGWFIFTVLVSLAGIVFLVFRFVFTHRYNRQLKEMVTLRTAELQESNAAKDSFFSILAHDLRNPFHVINGMLELLTQDYEHYTEKERKKMLCMLRTTTTSTTSLLENLLTWSRSQKQMLPVVPENIPLQELIDENVTLCEPAAFEKKIVIATSGDLTQSVYADRNMLHTVIRNLLSNAVKFTFPAGKITIDVKNGTDHQVTISISDTGRGMPPETIDKLFDIGSRITTPGTNNEKGTGLGLIICRDFILKNKGDLKVFSEEGKGSTFVINLPRQSEDSF